MMLRRRKCPNTFNTGDEVEVRCDDEGFKGAWYEARVLGHLPKRRRYSVVYESLADESDESRPLKEAVIPSYMRPRPPIPIGAQIVLHQLVDALYNDGWWTGVVSNLPTDLNAGIYTVRFPNTGDQMDFAPSDLRPHVDWVDGEWVKPPTQDKFIRSLDLSGAKADKQKQPSISTAHKRKVPTTVRGLSDGHNVLSKFPINATNSEIKNTEPCIKSEQGESIEDDSRLADCLAKFSKASNSVRTGQTITMPTLEMGQFEGVSCPMGSGQQSKALASPDQQPQQDEGVRELRAGKKTRKKGIPTRIKIIDTKAPSEGNEPKQVDGVADVRNEPEQIGEEVDMSFMGDSCSISDGIQSLCHDNEERNHEVSPNHDGDSVEDRQDNRLVGELSLEGRSTSQMEDRQNNRLVGCSNSMLLGASNSPQHNGAGIEAQNESLLSASGAPVAGAFTGDSVGDRQDNRLVGELSLEGCSTSQMEDRQENRLVSVLSLEGRSTSQMEDRQDNRLVGELSLEGRSTSQMEDRQDNRLVGCSNSILLGASNSPQHNGAGIEAQNESLVSASGAPVAGAITGNIHGKPSSEKSYWPFRKRSSLWESIETIKIISKMSQPPHFRPLKQFCEVLREGMAIGLMVTFFNLANSICALKIDDSRDRFDEKVMTLAHLEEHGFDVQDARAHLEELLRIKSNKEQLVEKRSALKVVISVKEKGKHRLNAEIKAVEKAVMALKQTLSRFCEKKQSLLKQTEENDSEIVKLQSDVREVEEMFQSTEHEFEGALCKLSV